MQRQDIASPSAGPADTTTIAFAWLVLAAFGMAFSLPLGRGLLAVSLVAALRAWWRGPRRVRLAPVAWCTLAFVLMALVSSAGGLDPARSLDKFPKLLWFAAIPLAAALVTSWGRAQILAGAYAWGGGVLALRTCIEHPVDAARLVEEGRFAGFSDALVHVGSMTDAQRLMVGGLLAGGLLLAAVRTGAPRSARGWLTVLVLLQVAALVLNFKRGTWFCAFGMCGLFVLWLRARWRCLAVVFLLGAALLAIPSVRARIGGLKAEFSGQGGGRMLMWTRIAPALVRAHPWTGIGYRALTNERMRAIEPRVEPKRDHLHSNVVQMVVDTGWIGLALYLAWMGAGLRDAGRFCRRARGDPAAGMVAAGVLVAFLGLLLNGLVEYNFGDAELVLAYGLLMGIAGGATRAPA